MFSELLRCRRNRKNVRPLSLRKTWEGRGQVRVECVQGRCKPGDLPRVLEDDLLRTGGKALFTV